MKLNVEKNLFLIGLFAFLLFSIGAITTTIVPPIVDQSMWSAGTNIVHSYTAQELRGIEIYKKKGVYCHTQQIRDLESDQIRYGWRLVHAPVSEAWEYVNKPIFISWYKRTGPDLSRVGGKYSSGGIGHFKNPRNMGEQYESPNGKYQAASIMPSYAYLSDDEIKDLTAYIQTLGRNKDWRVIDA